MNYNSKRWERIRETVLKRDRYLCQYFKRYGMNREANTVHHVIPVRERPDLECETKLMVSLSMVAHNKMHDRNTDELTADGKELANRIISRLSEDERQRMRLTFYE